VIAALAPTDAPLALALGLGGVWAFGWHMTWQLRQLDPEDPDNCLRLFRSNRDGGLLLALFLALTLLA
jgi:4-hydroxybenzoate polyprenyltransferase